MKTTIPNPIRRISPEPAIAKASFGRGCILPLLGAAAIACAPIAQDAFPAAARQQHPQIEVCFVLDTTGSMSGLIDGAKQKIWSIANEIVSANPKPQIRVGLVAYRDRGDDYVTRRFDLTNDLDAVYAQVQSFQAAGGGDEPESVNEALDDAVRLMSWSPDRDVLKMIFLVGDAPPHMDYANGPKYPDVCQAAAKKDLIINTVQCGNIASTTEIWQKIARLCEGNYAAIPQSGNMTVLVTPVDSELGELNRKLGATLVGYGSPATRGFLAAKQLASEDAPAAVAADRLAFNSATGVSVQGEGELLDSLSSGKVKLESIPKDELPAEFQKLNDTQLKAAIDKRQKERSEIQAQIEKLSRQRQDFIQQEERRLAASGKGDSFDAKVAEMIRTEADRKGIDYPR